MSGLVSSPGVHLAFASLHVLVGHLGSAALHRVRFGRNPLVLYTAGASAHQRRTRVVSALSLAWASALVLSALWSQFRIGPLTAPLCVIPWWVGWVVAAPSLVLMTCAQASMGRAFRVGQSASDPPEELRVRGLHALSRNPIYVGSWSYLAGMSLWFPSPLLVGLCAAIGLGIHGLVLAEEAYLLERFGDTFERYRRRVPRYIGLPRMEQR